MIKFFGNIIFKKKKGKSNKITRCGMKRDLCSCSYVDLCILWCIFLPRSHHLFSSNFTIRSLLLPLTSNSTSKIHRSVCTINPNNFELESPRQISLYLLTLAKRSRVPHFFLFSSIKMTKVRHWLNKKNLG